MRYVDKIQSMKKRPLVLEKGNSKFEFWICGPLPLLAVSCPSPFVLFLFVASV